MNTPNRRKPGFRSGPSSSPAYIDRVKPAMNPANTDRATPAMNPANNHPVQAPTQKPTQKPSPGKSAATGYSDFFKGATRTPGASRPGVINQDDENDDDDIRGNAIQRRLKKMKQKKG